MHFRIRDISRIFFFGTAALYPALIFYFLVIRKIETRVFSLFIMAIALLAFVTGTSRQVSTNSQKSGKLPVFWNFLLLFVLGVLCLIVNSSVILKFYPLLMNILLLSAFGSTLFFPPNMIFRFAALQDKSIKGSLGEKKVSAYCRTVTLVWCGFFVLNGSIAAWTIFSGSDIVWSVYNGGISYIMIGTLFAGEYAIRKVVQKKMPKAVPLSAFSKNSRPLSTVLCYEGAWSEAAHKTWGDFLEGTARLRQKINSVDDKNWLLYCDDCWHFFLAFTALLQCKKEILLSTNINPANIAEIRSTKDGENVPLLTDQVFPEGGRPDNTFLITSLLEAVSEADSHAEECPAINPDETSIIMYTSGSTGKSKAIKQRLTELENDNSFALSQWGEEILKRKVCSTVSHHHIYGLLWSILLPFTAGVPFRRTRINFTEELEKLVDTEYMIITVPAFLKRAVEMQAFADLNLRAPWIFTGGGVLSPQMAEKTREVFGFWPVEVYGSTETSGIAWRQSIHGLEWTVFDNAKINQNQDGCLVIRSPYIKDPAGFETADLVEILEDGRFLLKGRSDSIVKIEEKRISLLEVENRILQSGLIADACVIPLEYKRQYLAAAVVLNDKGKEQFTGFGKQAMNKFWREYLLQYFESIVIPKRWRYLETLPVDAQGKKKTEDIKLLFSREDVVSPASGFNGIKEKVIAKTENSVSLEFSIADTCSYFDGHFHNFPVLPAVAQVELIVRFASLYLGTGIVLSEIRRIKFTNIIRPFTPILLNIEKNGKDILFKIVSPEGNTVYSTGTLKLMEDK